MINNLPDFSNLPHTSTWTGHNARSSAWIMSWHVDTNMMWHEHHWCHHNTRDMNTDMNSWMWMQCNTKSSLISGSLYVCGQDICNWIVRALSYILFWHYPTLTLSYSDIIILRHYHTQTLSYSDIILLRHYLTLTLSYYYSAELDTFFLYINFPCLEKVLQM